MRYQIVSDTDVSALAAAVEALLRAGWRVQGGMQAIVIGGQATFYQAVVVGNQL